MPGSDPDGSPDDAAQIGPADVAAVFREASGRAVATLTRVFGDLGLAEDAVQDAFEVALRRWPADGVPRSPTGWIITTARRRALDHVRRESPRGRRETDAMRGSTDDEPPAPEEVGPVADASLRLLFPCCHPALAPAARVALTLRMGRARGAHSHGVNDPAEGARCGLPSS